MTFLLKTPQDQYFQGLEPESQKPMFAPLKVGAHHFISREQAHTLAENFKKDGIEVTVTIHEEPKADPKDQSNQIQMLGALLQQGSMAIKDMQNLMGEIMDDIQPIIDAAMKAESRDSRREAEAFKKKYFNKQEAQ